jgi:uncharacterized membrane protein
MYYAIVLWLHILAATLFIGPQVFLAVAGVPAARTIEDAGQRGRVTRVMTARFGWLGGGSLAILLITGIINYFHARDLGYIDNDLFPRYFIALQIKLTLVAIVVILTLLHGAFLGRKLQQLQEANASDAEIAQARRLSMLSSMATIAVSIAILFCAAILGSTWSKF